MGFLAGGRIAGKVIAALSKLTALGMDDVRKAISKLRLTSAGYVTIFFNQMKTEQVLFACSGEIFLRKDFYKRKYYWAWLIVRWALRMRRRFFSEGFS